MSDKNLTDTAAAVEAGAAGVTAGSRITHVAHPLDVSIRIPLNVNGVGGLVVMDGVVAELDKRYAARPRAGVATLTEVDSFIAHVKRWGSASSVVYANVEAMSLEAVLDDHPPDSTTAGARQHRAVYACPRSVEWRAWTGIDGKVQTQTQFADFIEAHFEDLIGADGYPAPTEILQMGRSLNILTKGTYTREMNPTNGDSIFVCKTETDAKSTAIPRAFRLGIPVFDGGDRYEIEARIRFALVEGRPTFTLGLHLRTSVERDAFGEVRGKVEKSTGRLVLAGTP